MKSKTGFTLFVCTLLAVFWVGCDNNTGKSQYAPPAFVGSGSMYIFQATDNWNNQIFLPHLNQWLTENPTFKVTQITGITNTNESTPHEYLVVVIDTQVPQPQAQGGQPVIPEVTTFPTANK